MTFITHGFQWYLTYERGYETSGSPLRFVLRRSSLIECVGVLHGNQCLQSVKFFFLWQYVQPWLLKNSKYTFYTIKSSLKLAYQMSVLKGNNSCKTHQMSVLKGNNSCKTHQMSVLKGNNWYVIQLRARYPPKSLSKHAYI